MPKTNIRKRREELGLTQQDVADSLGVNKSSVSRWEAGKDLKQKNLSLLSFVLRTSSSYLLGETEDPRASVIMSEPESEAIKAHMQENMFSQLAELAGFYESVDEDANVTIYNDLLVVNCTPELKKRVMEQIIRYFKFAIREEAAQGNV